MPHHPVVRPHAPIRHVPGPKQGLEGLHVLEARGLEGQDHLLDLDRRRKVAAQDGAGLQGPPQGGQRVPRLGEVQDGPVESLAGGRRVAHVAVPHLHPSRDVPEEVHDVGRGTLAVLGP
jgi:hypothetical protein